jgi:hypothetical protein
MLLFAAGVNVTCFTAAPSWLGCPSGLPKRLSPRAPKGNKTHSSTTCTPLRRSPDGAQSPRFFGQMRELLEPPATLRGFSRIVCPR